MAHVKAEARARPMAFDGPLRAGKDSPALKSLIGEFTTELIPFITPCGLRLSWVSWRRRPPRNDRAAEQGEAGEGVKRAIIASLLVIVTFSVGQARQAVTVARIEADLSAKGAKYVIDQYFDCDPSIGAGYALVESGTRDGVRLGVAMLKYSDACFGERLRSSLGTAMTRAPSVVLPYVNTSPRLAAEEICLPFLSADDERQKSRSVVTRARSSLLKVHIKALDSQKNACLREIEKAAAILK